MFSVIFFNKKTKDFLDSFNNDNHLFQNNEVVLENLKQKIIKIKFNANTPKEIPIKDKYKWTWTMKKNSILVGVFTVKDYKGHNINEFTNLVYNFFEKKEYSEIIEKLKEYKDESKIDTLVRMNKNVSKSISDAKNTLLINLDQYTNNINQADVIVNEVNTNAKEYVKNSGKLKQNMKDRNKNCKIIIIFLSVILIIMIIFAIKIFRTMIV